MNSIIGLDTIILETRYLLQEGEPKARKHSFPPEDCFEASFSINHTLSLMKYTMPLSQVGKA